MHGSPNKEPLEMARPPDVDEEKIEHLYQTTNTAIMGGILFLIFALVLIVIFLVYKHKNRHKGTF